MRNERDLPNALDSPVQLIYITHIHHFEVLMERTQIYLTEKERKALKALAARLGQSQSALIREAVDRFIDRYQEGNRLDLLRRGRGIWQDRSDLPDFDEVRRELDRFEPAQK